VNYTPPTVHPALIGQPVRNPSQACHCSRRYRGTSGGQPMRAFYLEITAKLIIRSNADPDDLPAEIYSRMAEFIPSDDDIIDIEVNAVPLPPDLCGSTPH
jgi:hypothetical protein